MTGLSRGSFAYAAIVVLGVTTAGSTRAQELNRDIKAANTQLGASFVAQYIDYAEPDTAGITGGANLDTETGAQPGGILSGRIQGTLFVLPNLFASATFMYAAGHTTYDGFSQARPTGKLTLAAANSGAATTDFHFRFGASVPLGDSAALTPLAVLGYHLWQRTLAAGELNALEEDFSHVELGGALMFQGAPVEHLTLMATGGVAAMVSPEVALGSRPPASLGSYPIFRAGGELRYQVVAGLQLVVGYDFVTYRYGRSDATQLATVVTFVPESRTRLHLMQCGVAYAF